MSKFKGLILGEDPYLPGSAELHGRGPQLFPLANTPLLHYVLETIRNASIDEVIIAAGATEIAELRDAIGLGEEWDLEVSYVEADPVLGAAHAIGMTESMVGRAPARLRGRHPRNPIHSAIHRAVRRRGPRRARDGRQRRWGSHRPPRL